MPGYVSIASRNGNRRSVRRLHVVAYSDAHDHQIQRLSSPMILQPVYEESEFSRAGIKFSAIVSGPRTAKVRYVMHIAVQSTRYSRFVIQTAAHTRQLTREAPRSPSSD